MSEYTILTDPLSREQVEELVTKSVELYGVDDFVSGVVEIGLSEVIERDLEQFLDLCSERLIGNDLLMQVDYDVVGHDGNMLHVKVSGDVSEALDLI